MQPVTESTEVLVVGAGPAGLATAAELGLHGRRCLVVDAGMRGGRSPRAKTTNVRTRELLRRWGVADRLAALSPFGIDHASDAVFATGMRGPELARFRNAMACHPARDPRFAEHAQWIPQDLVEQVLREAALAHPGVQLRTPAHLVSLQDVDGGVIATLEDAGGERSRVLARYVVGADGARSTVRAQLGIAMRGQSPLGHYRNHVFRAPGLHGRHALGQAAMYWLVNGSHSGVLSPLSADDLWVFSCARDAAGDDPAAAIRQAMDLDVAIELVAQDDWTAHQLVAERYGSGRIHLVGDACHLHPPFGGHGMNMGIGDAVDLGWKLAATLAGWGGAALLASYEVERRQVHQRVVDESVANHRHLAAGFHVPGLDAPGPQGDLLRAEAGRRIRETKAAEFDSLGLVIGCHYEESPVLARVTRDAAPLAAGSTYRPNARPGCRAPHLWLHEGRSRGASLYDHFHPTGFTLLATADDAQCDAQAAQVLAAAGEAGIPLCFLAPRHPALEALYGARFALVRPDQHVAWRDDDCGAALAALHVARGAAAAAATTP